LAVPPATGDKFPHERPSALALATIPAGSSRKALSAVAHQLVGIVVDSVNELREIASLCRTKEDYFNEIAAHRAAGMLSYKGIELTHGRKVAVDLNVRSQEDLAQWTDFSPETRMLLEAAFDAAERERGHLPGALRLHE
jgi:hypothetical protein